MGAPMDYAAYAPTYAWARKAVPWVLAPLEAEVAPGAAGEAVVEIGCGTANYVEALRARFPSRHFVGLDRSAEMLAQTHRRRGGVAYARADADRALPLRSTSVAVAFVVDVLHHLTEYRPFFAEIARVLSDRGVFVAVTDSEENMRRRSLTRFFPELLAVELARYPSLDALDAHAASAGLARSSTSLAEGLVDLDDGFVAALGAKCSSAMRLVDDTAHRRGMERVREARERGEQWLSSYSVLVYGRR